MGSELANLAVAVCGLFLSLAGLVVASLAITRSGRGNGSNDDPG